MEHLGGLAPVAFCAQTAVHVVVTVAANGEAGSSNSIRAEIQ
jgi:hypothetical protein